MILFGPGVTVDAPPAEYGNKAAVLAAMAKLGVPVPPGFSLNVSICEEYYENDRVLPEDVSSLLSCGTGYIERSTELSFGSARNPLLVSVRSGAPVTMPGVMDTILNVGLNRETVRGLIYRTGNPRFAWDSYRRFLEQFGKSVFAHDPQVYRAIIAQYLEREGVDDESALDFHSLREIAEQFERIFSRKNGRQFPDNVGDQLRLATEAVLGSWMSPRAEQYRSMHLVKGARGTAVTVQAMVFGNLGSASGAGVAFSRNPWTGEPGLLVDFKFGSQGEDVVSGDKGVATQREIQERLPGEYKALNEIAERLEKRFKDMQDLEFTIQEGALYILQSRSGKRAPYAALRITVDLWKEGAVSVKEARMMLEDIDIDHIVLRRVRTSDPPLATGISASSGVASGKIALNVDQALQFSGEGSVILVRETASPDDIQGIGVAEGILTSRGARTSHAAVVARQMGKVCIVNCNDLSIDAKRHLCRFGSTVVYEGDTITLDGETGAVYSGTVEVTLERPEQLLAVVRSWGL
jgi:pyruvate,orthophosphate dikinase